MATQDISRHLFQPQKRYAGARAQQRRVILDSDINEGELIDDEAQRVVVVDVVGPHGSSDDGFEIANVSGDAYDFEILAGSYFLGGMRHEIASQDPPGGPQQFTHQTDWAQFDRVGAVPGPLALPGADRHDLVYLVGWEQTVSAVEDGELLEQALGGQEAGLRVRHHHRAYVRTGVPADGDAAFDALVDALKDGVHDFDLAHHELKSAARLSVSYAADTDVDDPCDALGPWYTGRENQAIRVQLIGPTRYLWSYENASPLYRVKVTLEDDVATVDFQAMPPREAAFFPLKNQVIELLPWGARLPSGEHVADHPIAADIGGGVLGRVTTTYDPKAKRLVARITDPTKLANMLAWNTSTSAFLYLRVWNPGGGAPAEDPGVDFADDGPLSGTNLQLTFSGPGIVGDYWILAARPGAEKLQPWDLMNPEGAAPHGPRRFYCPLAVIHWTVDGEEVTGVAESWRRPFRPLTRLGGCCSVTVGDGARSFGDYTSIQAAILALPKGRPGKVCILPGTYEERVELYQRKDLVIEGCGAQTVIRPPTNNNSSEGLVRLTDCSGITLKDLTIEAAGQYGVQLLSNLANDASKPSPPIKLVRLAITTRRDDELPPPTPEQLFITGLSSAYPLPTIYTGSVKDVVIEACTCRMIGDLSGCANIFVSYSNRVVVRDCEILTPPGQNTMSQAWGGLHVAGGCDDVLIERNTIREGLGYGITLGSTKGGPPPTPEEPVDPGNPVQNGDCPVPDPDLPEPNVPEDEVGPLAPETGAHNVRILDNRISRMSSSGISVLGFFAEEKMTRDQIMTDHLVIAGNTIEDNYLHPITPLPASPIQTGAVGGIVLADAHDLRIHDNVIQRNGVEHYYPTCGIYVLHGDAIVIEDNLIRDNGKLANGLGLAGHRAGIALQFVGRAAFDFHGVLKLGEDRGQHAARIRGNTVLQPAGRALQVCAFGPIAVDGNVFVSRGLEAINQEQAQSAAHCVEVRNLAQTADRMLYPSEIVTMQPLQYPLPADPPPYLDHADGRTLFADNQVRFQPNIGRAASVFCATRIQSYGDVAVLGNHFTVKLPSLPSPNVGVLPHDTVVSGFTVRVCHNRWEDSIEHDADGSPLYIVTASASTTGFANITSYNQATRCIHAATTNLTPDGGVWVVPPLVTDNNQIFDETGC